MRLVKMLVSMIIMITLYANGVYFPTPSVFHNWRLPDSNNALRHSGFNLGKTFTEDAFTLRMELGIQLFVPESSQAQR